MRLSVQIIGLFLIAGSCLQQLPAQTVDYPEIISIDTLENIFFPVNFAHGKHARMETMGQGCSVCHHYAEDDDYSPCADCHLNDPTAGNLEEPTLNGAYHRNCLSCHREWSNDRVCETCHPRKRYRFNLRRTLDKTDIFSVRHPHIGSPDVVTFPTPEHDGTLVSFHHREHIDLYRYDCVTCHRSENCATCHDYQGSAELVEKTLAEHHAPCQTCHDTQAETSCRFCHQQQAGPGFTHAVTGWVLKDYHKQQDCTACHGDSRPIQAVNTACESCHADFETGEFEHDRTGFQLSEDHLELDCYDCHEDDTYQSPPACLECHDEDYVFPKYLPGKWLKEHR